MSKKYYEAYKQRWNWTNDPDWDKKWIVPKDWPCNIAPLISLRR